MDRLKSIFISLLVTFTLGLLGLSLWRLWQGSFSWQWMGNLLVWVTILGYFAKIYLVRTARTSKSMPLSFALVGAGLLMALFGSWQSGEWLPFGMAVDGLAGWSLYVFWATRFANRNGGEIQLGNKLPDVGFEDVDGNKIQISKYMNAPAVLLFYRGNWCPFCMAQIRELSEEYRRIAEAGASLIFISPQGQGHTRSLAKKFDIPAIFLIDKDLQASKQLGILNKYGTPFGMEALGFSTDNVLPTLVITDRKGVVRFADLTDNYRVRPEPGTYLKVLEGMGK